MWATWALRMVWTYATGRLPDAPVYVQCGCRASGIANLQEPGRMSEDEILALKPVAVRRCNACTPGQGHINLTYREADGRPATRPPKAGRDYIKHVLGVD